MQVIFAAGLSAATLFGAGCLTIHGAFAQGAQRLDGAYVALGSKCEEVFVKTKGEFKYSPKRNAFASALLIRGKSLSTPMATCQLSRVNRKGDVLEVSLQCANEISYAPVKGYFRLAPDGGITRLAEPDDTGGDRYEKCLP